MARANLRDEFKLNIRRDLCDRVGGMCSRPDCRVLTKGPRASSSKAKNIGRASHIHAASPGGPRYDGEQTPEQRSSFENGIWLCANHAAEVDDDEMRFPAEELRRWKRETEDLAEQLVGKSLITSGQAAKLGLVAIGPDVICTARVVGSSSGTWKLSVERFVLGDLGALRRYADGFGDLAQDDCYVCVEEDGVGRVLTEGPEIDITSGVVVELHVAAPMPLAEARVRFDVNRRGADIPIDVTGGEPDLDLSGLQVSGADTVAQTLLVHLSVCKGGYKIGAEAGSRVAEWIEKLGSTLATSFIALETIRLATVPFDDTLMKKTYVLLDFVERVHGVRLLPTSSKDFIKAAIRLDVHGLSGAREFVVPISIGTDELGPPPARPSIFG